MLLYFANQNAHVYTNSKHRRFLYKKEKKIPNKIAELNGVVP